VSIDILKEEHARGHVVCLRVASVMRPDHPAHEVKAGFKHQLAARNFHDAQMTISAVQKYTTSWREAYHDVILIAGR